MEQAQQVREQRQAQILGAVASMVAEDPRGTVMALIGSIFPILAKEFPVDLTAEKVAAIKASSSNVDEKQISERALNDDGVSFVLELSQMMAEIALSYNVNASVEPIVAADMKVLASGGIQTKAYRVADQAFKEIQVTGLSPYGVAAVLQQALLSNADAQGLHKFQAARILVEELKPKEL